MLNPERLGLALEVDAKLETVVLSIAGTRRQLLGHKSFRNAGIEHRAAA